MKKILQRTIAYLLIACIPAGLSACGEGTASFASGQKAYLAGDVETAVHDLKLSVSQGNDSGLTYAVLADALYDNGEPADAAEAAEIAAADTDDPAVFEYLGLYESRTGDTEAAEQYYRACINAAEEADDTELLHEAQGFLAFLYYDEGRSEEALVLFDALTRAEYKTTLHDMMLGLCYLQENQVYAATQYFDLLSDKKDVIPEYYVRIYKALYAMGEYTKANRYFDTGLQFCADNRKNTISSAEYYLLAGKTKAASENFANTDRVQAGLAEAQLYVHDGDYESAAAIYDGLLGNHPDDSSIYAAYMMLKVIEQDESGALQLYSMISSLDDPAAVQASDWNMIILYEKLGDYETAFYRTEEYLKLYPADTDAQRELKFLGRAMNSY